MSNKPIRDAFTLTFTGPDGDYSVAFRSDGDEGRIHAVIGNLELTWHIEVSEWVDARAIRLAGITSGSQPVLGDVYWFELLLSEPRPVLRYWDNQVLWREDKAI